MKGLLIKDYIGMKETLRVSLLTIILFIAIGIVSNNPMYVIMMIMIMGMNQTMTSMSYDQVSNWNEYSLTMPIKRGELVLSKYIFTLLNTIGSTLLSLLIVFLSIYKRSDMSIVELLVSHYAIFAMVILISSTIIPIVFKKGIEQARMAILGVTLLPMAIIGLIVFFVDKPEPQVLEELIKNIVMVSPIFLIGIFLISLKVSMNIIKNKDF